MEYPFLSKEELYDRYERGELHGIFRVDEQVYHDAPGLNASRLKELLKSAAHLKLYGTKKPDSRQQNAMNLGSLYHCMVLEPDYVDSRFAVAPEVDRRTKAGREAFNEFSESCGDKTVVSGPDFSVATGMKNALMNDPNFQRFMEHSEPELAMWWVDPHTGVLCKAKMDLLSKVFGVSDLKSYGKPATAQNFLYSVRDGYGVQVAHYLRGLRCLAPHFPQNFYFIVQEKEGPYAFRIFQMSQKLIEYWTDKTAGLYIDYRETKETNVYKGYDTKPVLLDEAAWFYKQEGV